MSNEAEELWKDRYEKWLHHLNAVIASVESAQAIPLGPSLVAPEPPAPSDARDRAAKIVYCAPHPDDEALSGALALRLHLDSGAPVTNVAITLGRDPAQKERRLREIESACRALDFRLIVAEPPHGFENVNEAARKQHPNEWAAKVETLAGIFDREKPDVVFAPHAQDFNTTHVGTHYLAVDALGTHLERTKRKPVLLVETEIWHQIERPNLMVGVTPELVARQLVGACEHGGEMRRNPYHLLHLCRLMDNVRRGSEVVGGQGAVAQKFPLAELYNVAVMNGKERIATRPEGVIVGPDRKADVGWLEAQFLGKSKTQT
ncbi:MAG: PIG-L deacetylase family protein [Terriglobia bacterium]